MKRWARFAVAAAMALAWASDAAIADISKYHVVLFGDPGSNKVMAKVMGKQPVQWTKDSCRLSTGKHIRESRG